MQLWGIVFGRKTVQLILLANEGCGMSRGMFDTFSQDQPFPGGTLIGFISDSHGQVKRLANGLAYLKDKGCDTLYHLGDICDSLHPETADACMGLLRDFQVRCVKGNNDHSIVVNHTGRESASIQTETLDYLRQLPLVRQLEDGFMAHSLPFDKELGLACMVGALTDDYARAFFRNSGDRILFRGHSHSPEIVWQDCEGRVVSENIPLEQTIEINERIPCIVTCGALDHSLCLLWSIEDGSITSLGF
jgi:predicted phosphodiesterase